MSEFLDKALPVGRQRAAEDIMNDVFANEMRKMMQKEMRSIFDEMMKEKKENPGAEDGGVFGGQDPRKMEMTIDQMVANAISGGKYTTHVLKILFGLVPSLIGR